jgi:hypothetical protein
MDGAADMLVVWARVALQRSCGVQRDGQRTTVWHGCPECDLNLYSAAARRPSCVSRIHGLSDGLPTTWLLSPPHTFK